MICRVRRKRLLDQHEGCVNEIYIYVNTIKSSNSSCFMSPAKPGLKRDVLHQLARVGDGGDNACRNLHRLIHRNKCLFPVEISVVPIRVALRKPTYRVESMYWPVLRMQAWVKSLLTEAPEFLLAGHQLGDVDGWRKTLSWFWSKYYKINPSHPVFHDHPDHLCDSVPYFLHGDEGRGQCHRPFYVEAFQPVLSHKGPQYTNESGYLGPILDPYSHAGIH